VLTVAIEKEPTPYDEDARLVERFLLGDETGFETLYRKYYEKTYSIARGILMDSDEAADATQEIFTQVYKHLPRFDRRSKFSTWLFRIAVNRSIQHSRSVKYKKNWVELNERVPEEQPEESVIEPRVHASMARMNPQDRAILTLFYWEELSLNEIADSLGIAMNAAKTRLYRARERFRSAYEDAHE
jgi:RNA polymerase sigma-70 factor, ECF subfamily